MTEPTEMELVVGMDGGVRCIYDEALDLRALGTLQITRASHVEPALATQRLTRSGSISKRSASHEQPG